MTSLAEVCESIAARAATVGLRTDAEVPEKVNPPACFVVLGEMERTAFALASHKIPFELVVLTSSAVGRTGQQALYGYANPDADDTGSVWAAFETNRSHGFTNVDVVLLKYRPLGLQEVAAYTYYGGVFEGVITFTREP